MSPQPDSFRHFHGRLLLALGLAAGCGERFDSESCIMVDPGTTECPAKEDVASDLLGPGCGETTVRVTGEGTLHSDTTDTGVSGDRCCYPVVKRNDPLDSCVVGRPYRDGAGILTAPEGRADRWQGRLRPRLRGLGPKERELLAAAWTREGLVEHASVAAFGRISLELLAFGAPADLVQDAHSAAMDEVRHARLCFGLAAAYGGAAVAPGSFPLGGSVPIAPDLAALADSTVREGCIAETLVALLDAEALAHAGDPAVRRVLAVITRDEARHSELSWRTLGWLLRIGGEPVRAVVREAFADLARGRFQPPVCTTGADPAVLLAHGRLTEAVAARGWTRGIAEVVGPAGRAALAGRPTMAGSTIGAPKLAVEAAAPA